MKRIVLIVVLLAVCFTAWYGYKEYNRKNIDLSGEKPTATVDALTLIASFERDTASASKHYVDKVIAVTGIIKKIEAEEAPAVFFLGEAGQMSSVLCSMDSTHAASYSSLKEGSKVTIKGLVNGYQSDESLGTDVKMNRCILQ
jgi:opacity protein-like surface antigen